MTYEFAFWYLVYAIIQLSILSRGMTLRNQGMGMILNILFAPLVLIIGTVTYFIFKEKG
jgi:Na+-transporting methylmalonyl-CoA/oxaloacetate decarboxylase gamma subunit